MGGLELGGGGCGLAGVLALMVGDLGLFCRREEWWESGKKKKN